MTTIESGIEWEWLDQGYRRALVGGLEVAVVGYLIERGWGACDVLGEDSQGVYHGGDMRAAERDAERLVRARVAEMAQALGLLPAPLAGRPLSKRERGQANNEIFGLRERIRWTLEDRHEHPLPCTPLSMRAELHDDVRYAVRDLRALQLALAADDALRASGTAVASAEVVRRERDGLAARVRRVEEILEAHGCDCDCGCDWDGHESDCDVCLGCRIEAALRPRKGAR